MLWGFGFALYVLLQLTSYSRFVSRGCSPHLGDGGPGQSDSCALSIGCGGSSRGWYDGNNRSTCNLQCRMKSQRQAVSGAWNRTLGTDAKLGSAELV